MDVCKRLFKKDYCHIRKWLIILAIAIVITAVVSIQTAAQTLAVVADFTANPIVTWPAQPPEWWPEGWAWPPQVPAQYTIPAQAPSWWPSNWAWPPQFDTSVTWPAQRPDWWPQDLAWPPQIPAQYTLPSQPPSWWPSDLAWPPQIDTEITWPAQRPDWWPQGWAWSPQIPTEYTIPAQAPSWWPSNWAWPPQFDTSVTWPAQRPDWWPQDLAWPPQIPTDSSEFMWPLNVPKTGHAPLKIQFMDKSSGGITEWLWDFGDGTTSTNASPKHSYLLPGTYTVTLTVTGPGGSASKVKKDYISVLPAAPIVITLKAGWNMVSVPVIPTDNSVSAVFPGAAAVYTWNPATKNYTTPTTVLPEKGYWVAVTADENITVSGVPVSTWTTNITAGWNMIGSVINNADFTSPNDNPDNSVQNFVYWWDPGSKSYKNVSAIEPFKGYWAASVNDCAFTMP
jgi:hypothetical protein